MSERIAPTQKMPFKMYPLNKSHSGIYSYYESSPIVSFQWSENISRLINSNSLYLCGKMKVMHKQGKQMPATRFDLNGSATDDVEAYEQAAYIDDRIGVNSFIDSVTVGDLKGSMYEQANNYNRNLSSAIAVTNSYKSLCTYSNMSLTSCANNDVMARECSSEIEFAIPISCGYSVQRIHPIGTWTRDQDQPCWRFTGCVWYVWIQLRVPVVRCVRHGRLHDVIQTIDWSPVELQFIPQLPERNEQWKRSPEHQPTS